MGNALDVAEILKQINGNKELMAQIAKADPKEGVALLKKANIDVTEDDIKKVQATVADGKLDLGDLKDLSVGLVKKLLRQERGVIPGKETLLIFSGIGTLNN
jgi:hypothetical protein